MCRGCTFYCPEYLSGKDCCTTWEDLEYSRGTFVLQLCRECPHADWHVYVWVRKMKSSDRCLHISLLRSWTSFSSIHWIVPTIAITLATMGIFSIYLATFNYLADTYHRYASSVLAAQSFCRNMMGGVFPLVTHAMFRKMTFAGASSFLGGLVCSKLLSSLFLTLNCPREPS